MRDKSGTGNPRSRHIHSRRRRFIAFAAAAAVGAATVTIIAPLMAVGDPCNAIDPGAVLAPSSSTTCVHSFTASGSWTVPVGVTSVDVLAVGGGGGGGGSYWESDFYLGAGGGGGGGQVKTQGSNSVTAGASLTIVIGTGGAGGPAQTTSAAGTGSRGGTTSMTNGTWTASAAGGMGGTNAKQAESLSGGNNGGNDQSPISGGAGNAGAGSYSWPTPSTAGLTGNVVGAGGGGGGGGGYAAGTSATRTIPNPFTYATSAGGNGGAGSDQASSYAAGTVGIGGGGGAISQGSSSVGVATAGSGDTVRSSGTGGTTTVLRTSAAATYTATSTAPVGGSTNTGGGGGGAALVATSGSSVTSAAGASGGSGLLVVRYSPSVAFSDTTLTSLVLGAGSLTPTFASGTTSYTASVSYSVASTTVTPTVTQPSSSVTVNGSTVVSGAASAAIPLTVGTNTVTVIVTAQNAATRTYTVTVTRSAASTIATLSNLVVSAGSLSPSFSSSTTSYTSSVADTVTSTTVTPTVTNANATVTVNGTTVASAATSAVISLYAGSNIIPVVVTAQDGTTVQTYNVTISRAAAAGGGSSSGGGGSTTSTTDPSAAATLTVTPAGLLEPVVESTTQSVSPGSAVVLVGGVPTTITVAPSSRRDGMQVSGEGWKFDLAGTLANGTPAPLDANGTMRVVQGHGLAAAGAGFAPNTQASIYIFPASLNRSAVGTVRAGTSVPESGPLLLGNLTVAVDGTFAGSVPVPDTLTPGDFVAQVNGYTPAFQVRSASVGLVVAAEQVRVVEKLRARITFTAESPVLTMAAKRRLASLVRSIPKQATGVTIQSIGYVQPSQNSSNDISLSTGRATNAMLAMNELLAKRSDALRGRSFVSGRGQAAELGPGGRMVQVVIAYTLG